MLERFLFTPAQQFYGNLGQDVIKQFDKMSLDFKSMQLIFQ